MIRSSAPRNGSFLEDFDNDDELPGIDDELFEDEELYEFDPEMD